MNLYSKIVKVCRPIAIASRQSLKNWGMEGPSLYQLDTFTQPGDEGKLTVVDDSSIGGSSRGVVVFKPEDNAVTLLGNILVDKRFTLQTTPFVGMEYFFPNSLNLRDFKSLRLRMRTDGNVYKVKMLIASSYDFGNHEVHGYVVDKSQQWETYELPFERFQFQGYDQVTTRLGEQHSKLQLHQIQILRELSRDDKFAVQLQEISISTECLETGKEDPVFEKLAEKEQAKRRRDAKPKEKANPGKSLNDFY